MITPRSIATLGGRDGHSGNPPNSNLPGRHDTPRQYPANLVYTNGGDGGDPPGNDPPGIVTYNPNFPNRNRLVVIGQGKIVNTSEIHFDTKLKPDAVPTWDGDDEALGKWMTILNELAEKSNSVFRGLGDIVPMRFRGRASKWWLSLAEADRQIASQDWDTLRETIRTYWMNHDWLARIQDKALRATFREKGHGSESPTDYFMRKRELLALAWNLPARQVIREIFRNAPIMWRAALQYQSIASLSHLQLAMKYNEEYLETLINHLEPQYKKRSKEDGKKGSSFRALLKAPFKRRAYNAEVEIEDEEVDLEAYRIEKNNRPRFRKSTPNFSNDKVKTAKTYAVGWNGNRPKFPKDNKNVSKGRTPEQYGARGCKYCGSRKHWDVECIHAKDESNNAKVFFTEWSAVAMHAEANYQEAYEDGQLPEEESSITYFAKQDKDQEDERSSEEESDF